MLKFVYLIFFCGILSGIAIAEDSITHWKYDGNDSVGYTADTGFGYSADLLTDSQKGGLQIDDAKTVLMSNFLDTEQNSAGVGIKSGYYPITIPSGFSFPFYGVRYGEGQHINVSVSGLITFGDNVESVNAYADTDIPDNSKPHEALYAYWVKMTMTTASSVEYGLGTDGGRTVFIIKYSNFLDKGESGSFNFEVALYENGDIRIYIASCKNYFAMDGDARVGIEGQIGSSLDVYGMQLAKYIHLEVQAGIVDKGFFIYYPETTSGIANFTPQAGHDAGSGCIIKTLSPSK